MKGPEPVELCVRLQSIEQRDTARRAVRASDGDCATDAHHGSGIVHFEESVQDGDLGPVGLVRGGGLGVHGRDRRLDRVQTGVCLCRSVFRERDALGDERPVPEPAILVIQRNRSAVGVESSRPAGLGEQQKGEQSGRLGVGEQCAQGAREGDGLAGEIVADVRVPGRAREPLGEQQVDDSQDPAEPTREIALARRRERNTQRADPLLGAHDSLLGRRYRDQQRMRDLRGGQPGDEPEGERDPVLGA